MSCSFYKGVLGTRGKVLCGAAGVTTAVASTYGALVTIPYWGPVAFYPIGRLMDGIMHGICWGGDRVIGVMERVPMPKLSEDSNTLSTLSKYKPSDRTSGLLISTSMSIIGGGVGAVWGVETVGDLKKYGSEVRAMKECCPIIRTSAIQVFKTGFSGGMSMVGLTIALAGIRGGWDLLNQ